MDNKDTFYRIAVLAQSMIEVCHSDLEDKTEAIEALAQKVGYLADKALSESGGGVKRELGDWFT